MTTYKCPKCESTNLVARLDGRLNINTGDYQPETPAAVADVTAWRHVDCLGCDESFEGHELDVVEGFTCTLEQLADVLRKHGAVDSSTVEVLYTGGNIYNVKASLQWSWGEDDDSSREYAAGLLCRFAGDGEASHGADDAIIINIESTDDSPNQHGMASCPMKDYASVDEIEKDVLMFVDAGLCLFMSEILGREIISL